MNLFQKGFCVFDIIVVDLFVIDNREEYTSDESKILESKTVKTFDATLNNLDKNVKVLKLVAVILI